MHTLHAVTSFVAAHPLAIGFWLAVYAAVATLVNTYAWPKPVSPPASPWTVRAHWLLIDWPASLPSRGADGRGLIFKVGDTTIAVPYASWSQLLAGPPPEAITKRQIVTPPPTPRKDKGEADFETVMMLFAIGIIIVSGLVVVDCGGVQ